MKKVTYLLGLLAMSAPTVQAATCEESFQVIGDARNGLTFVGRVEKPGLGTSSALGQLQKIAADEEFEIGQELISGESGEVFFTQTTNNPPVVVRATADDSGTVMLGTKLAPGQQMSADAGRGYICGMLNQLKTGPEGDAIAAEGRAKSQSTVAVDAKAVELSAQIQREIEKTMAPVNRKGAMRDLLLGTTTTPSQSEAAGAFVPIRAKYMGRMYRIDGQVNTTDRDTHRYGPGPHSMNIAFDTRRKKGLLGLTKQSGSSAHLLNFHIQCVLADDQMMLYGSLNPGDWVTLTGTVSEIHPKGMVLRDCRQ